MAPAPLPADPTPLTLPLTNTKLPATSCASRQFPTPLIAPTDESQQNQNPKEKNSAPYDYTTNNSSSNRNTSNQGSRIYLSCLKNQVNTLNSNYETQINNKLEKQRNDTQDSNQKEEHENTENFLVKEVRHRYNRLSLKVTIIAILDKFWNPK